MRGYYCDISLLSSRNLALFRLSARTTRTGGHSLRSCNMIDRMLQVYRAIGH